MVSAIPFFFMGGAFQESSVRGEGREVVYSPYRSSRSRQEGVRLVNRCVANSWPFSIESRRRNPSYLFP